LTTLGPEGEDLLPRAVDHHKPDRPLIPNGLGFVYVLVSAIYLFLLYYLDHVEALPLAGCILFGGFMGLLDDWIDLRWRYKAFLPIFASFPLAVLREGNPIMATYFFGKIDFSQFLLNGFPLGETIFYFGVIPLIVTVTTNTINQLGGLNGLETVCPSIVMVGLMLTSPGSILLIVPLAAYLVLATFNFLGRIFVGNTGSFAVGITLASFAIIADNEQTLLVSTLPFMLNSLLILLNVFLLGKTARLTLKGNTLVSDHRRSLLTLLAFRRPLSERKLVIVVSLIVALFAFLAYVVWSVT
jgi:UDP-N-acetylglucosamine--dolichyl-phosphate N-acetylglucosaminephosphotransferase